jgi:bacteriocin-like protein
MKKEKKEKNYSEKRISEKVVANLKKLDEKDLQSTYGGTFIWDVKLACFVYVF